MTKDNNTTSVFGFLGGYLFWQVIFFIWHRNLIFKCIDGRSFHESMVLMWALLVASALICCITVVKYNRNSFNIVISTALPLEIYTVITYFEFFKKSISAVLVVLSVLLVAYGFLMFRQKIKNKAEYWSIFLKRLYRYVYFSRAIAVICLAVVVAPLLFKAVLSQPLYKAQTDPVEATDKNTYTIANNIDTVCKLQEHVWKELSLTERTEVLQVIANIEANYLGIPTELRVTADNLGVRIAGQYNDNEHRISIDIDHLKNSTAREVLETLCHEAYHGYEKRLTDLYAKLSHEDRRLLLFADAKEYTREFANYKTDEDYYQQWVERDSRIYAYEAAEDYYSRIEKHLKTKN